MSKHSPGPWSFDLDGNYAKIYLHSEGKPCKIKGSDSLRGYCGEANARLIAAAPEMLEAMKGLEEAFCSYLDTREGRHKARLAIIAAKAAIKKAEGGEG